MTLSLQRRLDACLEKGAMSVADLALWLDLSYGTVRSYRQGSLPHAARRSQIDQCLALLEQAIKHDGRLPVPLSVRAGERRKYILGVRTGGRHKRK